MAAFGRFAPAIIRRAFFILGASASLVLAAVPLVKPPELAQVGLPTAAETAQILAQLRETGVQGDYYLEIELRSLPRRGTESTFRGRMWGSRNAIGAITRIAVTDAGNVEQRLLVQNGAQPSVWRAVGGKVGHLEVSALFQPVIPGVNLTTFDLQMPFLHWPNPALEKVARMRGRPAHVFLFTPPAAFAAKYPDLGAVRVYLDAQYNAPTQIESIGRNGRVTKTLSLLDLKKVGEQWIPRSFEVRDETTRDKTRLNVTAVALSLTLPSSGFAPAALNENMSSPAPERIQQIAP